MNKIECKMLGAGLVSVLGTMLAASAAAQTMAPTDTTSAGQTHRIVLPRPKAAQNAPSSARAFATAPIASSTAATPAPDQAAGQAAVAALMRQMAALRDTPSSNTHKTTTAATPAPGAAVTTPVKAGPAAATHVRANALKASSTPTTLASNDTMPSIVSPRTSMTNDVLGNLAPPSSTTDAAAFSAPVSSSASNSTLQSAAIAQVHAADQGPVVLARHGAHPVENAPANPSAAARTAPAAAPSTPAAALAAVIPPPMTVVSAPLVSGAMMGNFNSTEVAEKMMHVAVGHTIFIDTRRRLTRVYVTDPSILNSYTANPNQIVVTALKPGASTVLVWDEAGETQAYMISADMGVEALQRALTQGFPGDAIHVEGDEDRVVLSGYVGTEENAINAGKLSTQFTKNVTNSLVVNSSRVKQVRLKVRIVEVDRSKLAEFGFNFFSVGGKNIASTTTNQYSSSITGGGTSTTIGSPLNFSLYSSRLNVGMTLEDLATANIAQILAEPTITSMSGQKASFIAGGQFPFPVVQSSAGSAATVTLQFMPYGVKLDFTPRVNPDGTIDLKVTPEVSALDYANAVTLAGYTVPAISTRKADTELVLESGQSFAISGLLDQRITDVLEHTPGISSVPILGELFKSKNVNRSIQELVVIVTPTLVDPIADAAAAEAGAPPTPNQPLPFLNRDKFDHDLPKGEKKQQ